MADPAQPDVATGYASAVPSVVRALHVLEELRNAHEGLTLAELSRRLHVNPSSLLAILRTLRAPGYVERDGDRYRPGSALATVAGVSEASNSIRLAVDAVSTLAQAATNAVPDEPAAGRAGAFRALGLAASELSAVLLGEATATTAATSEKDPIWRPEASGPLEPSELDVFLRGGWLATLSCLKENGYPYSVPVWYHWDQDRFWVVPRGRAEWARYLLLDPRVSLAVGEPVVPFRRALVEGHAEHVDGPHASVLARDLSVLMATRYLGSAAGPYLETIAAGQSLAFEIVPEKIVTWRGLAPHARYQSIAAETVGRIGVA